MALFDGGRFNSFWDYVNPISYIGTVMDNLEDGYQFGDFSLGLFGHDTRQDSSGKEEARASEVVNQQEILGQVVNDSRDQYLEDREHTEAREDSAYQRAVSDMRKAGLNPYTVGSSPAASSVSKVGENSIASKVELLGYLLNLKNLDLNNKKLTNNIIGNILKTVA